MRLRDRLQETEEWWWYSVGGGLFVVSATAISYWQTGSELSPSVIVVAALVVGYVAKRRSAYDDRLGGRVGIVGGFPVLLESYDSVVYILELSYTPMVTVANLAFLAAFVGFGFGLAALLGEVGAKVGYRLAGRTGRSRRASHSHQ